VEPGGPPEISRITDRSVRKLVGLPGRALGAAEWCTRIGTGGLMPELAGSCVSVAGRGNQLFFIITWPRLIEILAALERSRALLDDPEILHQDMLRAHCRGETP